MLPSAPKTLGRLSDVFISALGAITGKANRLGFKPATRVCVILVDGLGAENIRRGAGHAPFLNAALKGSKSINTVFPTTTAAAITSFGVGAQPGIHGVFERASNRVRNLLSGWDAAFTPASFQRLTSVASAAEDQGVRAFTVGPAEYSDSGFTNLNMSGAEYRPAKSFGERVSETKGILSAKQKSLTYLYFPELDSIAHAYGVNSTAWLMKLEDLDAAVRDLVSDLPKGAAVLLTADHGVIDVRHDSQILLDEFEIDGLLAVTGDPRNSFLYFESESKAAGAKATLVEQLEGRAMVCTPQELKEAGWLSHEVTNGEYLPDLFLISEEGYACYHRGFAKPHSLKMIGQHGGISQTELSVPLLKFGEFAS